MLPTNRQRRQGCWVSPATAVVSLAVYTFVLVAGMHLMQVQPPPSPPPLPPRLTVPPTPTPPSIEAVVASEVAMQEARLKKLLNERLGVVERALQSVEQRLPTSPPRPPPLPPPKKKTPAPTQPPKASPACLKHLDELTSDRLPWLVVEPRIGRTAATPTVLDLRSGTVVVWVGVSRSAKDCFRLVTGQLDIDPYIEMYRLRYNPSKHPCDVALKQHLKDLFGDPTPPFSDVWHLAVPPPHVRNVAAYAFQVTLRPRWGFDDSEALNASFRLPAACLVPEAPNASIPEVEVSLRIDTNHRMKVAGDLLEGLHDGVLADGGRTAHFVLSRGLRWGWKEPGFVERVRGLLDDLFGTPDPPHVDSILKGPDIRALSVVLAPRSNAVLMTGTTVPAFPHLPNHLLAEPKPDTPVAVSEVIRIEDVVTPFAEISSATLLPWVREEAFVAGGQRFNILLHAGVFFKRPWKSVEAELARGLVKAYGPAADRVTITSDTTAEVVLGARQGVHSGKAATHVVLSLTLPSSSLLVPSANCSRACLLPQTQGCSYSTYQGPPLVPYPSITVQLRPRMVFDWAVVGAGPSGVNGIGRVLDIREGNESSIFWADARGFKVGRLEGYHDVQSMNPCSDFLSYLNDFKVYSAMDLGPSKVPLMAYEGNKKHCRLGFLSEPLLKVTHTVRTRVVSAPEPVTDLHKVWHPGANRQDPASVAFTWSLRVGEREPVWVTHGVIICIGADHRQLKFDFQAPPTVPFTAVLNPGRLRAFMVEHPSMRGRKDVQLHVAVFGAGPSGVVALHNLALVPEVTNVTHIPKKRSMASDYSKLDTVRLNGEYVNITRQAYDPAVLPKLLSDVDFTVQMIGWQFPTFPYNGSIVPVNNKGIYVSPKLFNIGANHARESTKAQLYFISSLRSLSKASINCKAPEPDCFLSTYPPPPLGLIDPNADAKGGYAAS